MANDLNFIFSLIGTAVGLTFWLAPDLFWNPDYGLAPFKFLTSDALVADGGGSLDPLIRCGLRGAGSTMASQGLFHLFRTKAKDLPYVLRFKMAMLLFHIASCCHPVLFAGPNEIVKEFFMFLIVFKVAVLCALWPVYQDACRDAGVDAAELFSTKKSWTTSAMVSMLYALPFGLMFVLIPQEFGPQGNLALYTSEPPNEWSLNDAHFYALRFEGSTILSTAFAIFDTRDRPLLELSLMGAVFYTLAFVDGSMDTTGMAKNGLHAAALGLHALYVAYLAVEFSRKQADTKANRDAPEMKGSDAAGGEEEEKKMKPTYFNEQQEKKMKAA